MNPNNNSAKESLKIHLPPVEKNTGKDDVKVDRRELDE